MTNQEILEKAIQKAIDGGWENGKELLPFHMTTHLAPETFPDIEITHKVLELEGGDYVNVEAIIFSHDFAKALWGERNVKDLGPASEDGSIHGIDVDTESGWQYYLQQMVIAEDPIKYLGENL